MAWLGWVKIVTTRILSGWTRLSNDNGALIAGTAARSYDQGHDREFVIDD